MDGIRLALLGGTVAVAGLAAAAQTPTAHAAPHKTILSKQTADGFRFSPAKTTIKAGTAVTWKNDSAAPHTVTSKNMKTWKFDKKQASDGGSVTYTFKKTGTFKYFCQYHEGMVATIVVK
jgi:plastocyanin